MTAAVSRWWSVFWLKSSFSYLALHWDFVSILESLICDEGRQIACDEIQKDASIQVWSLMRRVTQR